jgi:REP element-mobilizing transposase RayT
MANTFTQLFYHIVFSTKERRPQLAEARREELFHYIWGINKRIDCHLHRINAVEDHMHILTSVHPSVALAAYIAKVKTSTTNWIRRNKVFRRWDGWQDGYSAFTLSIAEKDAVTEYIKGQIEHHRKISFLDEYKRLLREAGIDFDEKYLA